MMDTRTRDTVQGELERLFSLDQMKMLTAEALGLDPSQIGGTHTAGAFARALVDYCQSQEALPALVDAMLLLSKRTRADLRSSLRRLANGELKPGATVGDLRVVKKLGEGGLGVVYLAESQVNGHREQAALKVIRPEYSRDRAAVLRYITAARLMRKLSPQGVVAIKAAGQLADARPWVATTYLPGQTLAEHLKRSGPLHVQEALPIFREVLQALSSLHQRGLCHGDIKTENVILAPQAGMQDPVAVLVDPGGDRLLASHVGPQDVSVTGARSLAGTPKALAPEVARGAEPSPVSEVYAVGTLIYETLTGRQPFEGDSAIDVIAAHLNMVPDPPSLHASKGSISGALDHVVLRALAKQPKDRYADVRTLAEALETAAHKPAADRPLDEIAFRKACDQLKVDPSNDAYAQQIEDLAGDAGAWERAAQVLWSASEQCHGTPDRIELQLRVARIYEQELQEPVRAEDVFLSILELDSEHNGARFGVERARRSLDDPKGLIDVLIARAKRSERRAERLGLFAEVAELYAARMNDPQNAARYYTQILLSQPTDEAARQGLFGLGLGNQAMWAEVLQVLGNAAQVLSVRLKSSDRQARRAAEQAVQDARADVRHWRGQLEQRAVARKAVAPPKAQKARFGRQSKPASAPELHASQSSLVVRLDQARQALGRMEAEIAQRNAALGEAHVEAEAKLDQYETLRARIGDSPNDEELELLARMAEEAEEAVDAADAGEIRLEHLNAQLQQEQQRVEALAAELQAVRGRGEDTDEISLVFGRDIELLDMTDVDLVEVDDVGNDEEERAQLAASEARLADAEAAFAALAGNGEAEDEPDSGDWADGAALHTLLGDLYLLQLKRPDLAESSFREALALDERYEPAMRGLVEVFRSTRAWDSLCELLLQRAERAPTGALARNLKAEAAKLLIDKLDDLDRALPLLQEVIADDPGHDSAYEALTTLLMRKEDYSALVPLLEQKLRDQEGVDEIATRLQLSELYEKLNDPKKALAHYRAVLQLDDQNRAAAKGVRRFAEVVDDRDALALAIRAEVSLAATPKQRIQALERLAQLEEDEFVNYGGAAACYERIIELNPRHAPANRALPRLYRRLGRPRDAANILVQHAEFTEDNAEKADLWMQAAQLFSGHAGDSGSAIELCERTLRLDANRTDALSLLAQLRAASGELDAALEAVERLADQAPSGRPRALALLRMAGMSETAGDNEAAMHSYKRALDEDPGSEEAINRLLLMYKEQGDVHGAVDMLRRAVTAADGDLRRAQLLAELGSLQLDALGIEGQAKVTLQEAQKLDPANVMAAAGLGRLALVEGEHEAAAAFFKVALGRPGAMPKGLTAQVSFHAGEAMMQLGDISGALVAFRNAYELDPEPLIYHERYADAVWKSGEVVQARSLYSGILNGFGERLDPEESQRLLLRLSETQRALGDNEAALGTLQRARRLGENAALLGGLAETYAELRSWTELVSVLQRQAAECEDAARRYEIHMRIGDVLLEQQGDLHAAAQHYSLALEEQPRDREVLQKLLKVYSDLGMWPQLVEVIRSLAEVLVDPNERSRYYEMAATIALDELQRYDEAARLFKASLAGLPAMAADKQFEAMCDCMKRNLDWRGLEQAYMDHYARLQECQAGGQKLARVLDARAAVLRDHLDRPREAIEVLEQAQALDPDNVQRLATLTNAYSRDPERYFSRAVATPRRLLELDPCDTGAFRALRKVYTGAKRPDEAWCLCQALRLLGAANDDEETFFKKYRLTRLVRFRQPISDEMFRNFVVHPEQDPLLTGIFATMTPAMVMIQSHPLEAFGLTPEQQTDPRTDHTAIGRMLALAGDAVGNRIPEVYHCPHDPGGLSFLCVVPPAIGIGRGAAAGGPPQALAFVAARHSSYYRPGHLPRQLVPTGTGLKAWLMASIRMVSSAFGIPPNLERQVEESFNALATYLTGPQRDTLRSMTQKLLDAAPELDMRRWMAAVDLTADRVGFILSNDLKLSRAVIEASPEDAASLAHSQRVKELIRYATSEPYFELRKHLGIALGG